MPETIASLMEKLVPDPWRVEHGFSDETAQALDLTLNFKVGKEREAEAVLNDWIRRYQPCLFGRIAAKEAAITYCLVSEDELCGSEVELASHIQEARLRWTRAGFAGKSSNFIIAVLSRKLAQAVPDETVTAIALRLCSRYLQEHIESDRIYLDRIWLRQKASEEVVWEWLAGVNYFSAQGDRRWWQDHRFPAGIAFSVNSVGHMVKSGRLEKALRDLAETMGTASSKFRAPDVRSLEQALGIAMATIHRASNGPSGKATRLLPLKGAERSCPVEIPPALREFDPSHYEGFYHTDFTIPSEYFRPDVLRPKDVHPLDLDFTYLYNKDLDNPDYDRMGEGRRIMVEGRSGIVPTQSERYMKRLRGLETEVRIDDVPRLKKALSMRD